MFQLISDGENTFCEVNGIMIGRGVKNIAFTHQAGESAIISITAELKDFCLMEGSLDHIKALWEKKEE